MLRIKNNVDLKQLKKYGFKKENFQYIVNTCKKSETELDGFAIDLNTREIINYAVSSDTLDILYDLIQFDLVEKVDDK